jgi:hypothetical protein
MKNSKNIEKYIENNLSHLSYGKYLLLKNFYKIILDYRLPNQLKIAVIGGGENQAEIEILKQLGFQTEVTTFGIEDEDIFLDLNKFEPIPTNLFFDLVICTQVLEHIWNHENFFNNLQLISHPKSILYLNCPKSNKVHMAPIFYSSGFTASYLEKNLENKNFNILHSGELGGEIHYKSIHITQSWYSKNDIENGYRFNKNKLFYKIKHLFKLSNLGQFLVLKRNNNRQTEEFMTQSYAFAKRV